MPYKFIDGVVVADITFEASGDTLEELFESSANAVTNAMIDKLERIEAKEERKITLEAETEEKLLHKFLDEILFYKDADNIVFSKYKIKIKEKKAAHGCDERSNFILECIAKGEEIDNAKHTVLTDVKAVSWHMFKFEKGKQWKVQVVLDV
ncbi:archease [Candidatus Micrarchaeota archaeon]|nr:archease [Candidatus Micrarchaeota archaeon]MBU1166466.1 archease [Candidatus Micrarchaeota archaeon]MBU1886172.1 archease [Candidatus Micrarchaeota archaeon]